MEISYGMVLDSAVVLSGIKLARMLPPREAEREAAG